MSIANSSKIVTFQANRELVNDAMEVLKEQNLSLSSAQAEVQESYAKIEAGNYLTDEDVVTRYGL